MNLMFKHLDVVAWATRTQVDHRQRWRETAIGKRKGGGIAEVMHCFTVSGLKFQFSGLTDAPGLI